MDSKAFGGIRRRMAKTQKEMAQLLGVSLKAVQSFEQGWRNVPMHVERQLMFLLARLASSGKKVEPCWSVLKCPTETKRRCPAWEFQSGDLCWFINGTICHGDPEKSWKEKMELCRECEMFRNTIFNLQP